MCRIAPLCFLSPPSQVDARLPRGDLVERAHQLGMPARLVCEHHTAFARRVAEHAWQGGSVPELRANASIFGLSEQGQVSVQAEGADVDFWLDVLGYFE
jgi:hypothetical protein